jgi:hypothetical protein
MPRLRYTLQQRVFIYDNFVKTESVGTVRRRFQDQFPDSAVPNWSCVHKIVNKLRETGSLCDKKTELKR